MEQWADRRRSTRLPLPDARKPGVAVAPAYLVRGMVLPIPGRMAGIDTRIAGHGAALRGKWNRGGTRRTASFWQWDHRL